MSTYEWEPGMGEISGFGNGYEDCCRAMLRAALEWFDAHPTADPKFQGYQGVYGMITDYNADAKALSDTVIAAARDLGGATGAQHQAVINHALWIRAHGWPAYVAKMIEREAKERGGAA